MLSDYDKIRAFEYDVLDKHHQTYLFCQFSEDIVIPYLLQTYGDTERHRDNLVRNGHNETNLSFYLNNMLHGIGHCIRWMINKDNLESKDASGNTYQQIHEMAADFLGWGTGYHMIAQEFVTWSRNIKEASLNEETRTITFLNPTGFSYNKIYSNQLLYAARMAAVFESYPHEEMEIEFNEWVKEIDFGQPPIANHIRWQRGRTSKSYPFLYLKMKDILFPELDETTDFQGYNLKELRQFYALVFLSFHFIKWVETVLDSKAGEDKLSFGSNPLEFEQKQFEKLISEITGLEVNISCAIIADLTFNPGSFHTSVSIQPFIRSASGKYYILPNLFALLEPSRMILGAINKGGKKKKYDALINIIEKVNLNSIYKSANGIKGCICYIEKLIKINGNQIHPDLILIDSANKFLLIADYKHFIGPVTASEVVYKMKELEKGLNQVQNYIEHLTKLPNIGQVNIQEFSISGLIITHKPLPVPIPKSNKIPIIDLESFTECVKNAVQKGRSVNDVSQEINENFFAGPVLKFEDFESEIPVGDWIVKRMDHKIN
ncbi:hypothetical protein [Sediminibacterium soli]|uniref:hypothetical protein n=1 Tax=Sediminibacterium soli TaxID=2698829 RepID=UPI00137AB61E|nr:hypothetical protein [Sediminibacterium soli]NCI46723.1 hypothetical protein [Sediminibacterium soli]